MGGTRLVDGLLSRFLLEALIDASVVQFPSIDAPFFSVCPIIVAPARALGMPGLFEEIIDQSASPLFFNKIPVFAGLSCIIAPRNGPICSRPMSLGECLCGNLGVYVLGWMS